MVLKSDEAALLMLPLLVDGRVDAADRPVRKEPAELAHRRRPRGLLQQHKEQCSFDLHSPQKQAEMTGAFGVSTRSSSRGFIRCAARPETPRAHRERQACAGAGVMSVLSAQLTCAPWLALRLRGLGQPGVTLDSGTSCTFGRRDRIHMHGPGNSGDDEDVHVAMLETPDAASATPGGSGGLGGSGGVGGGSSGGDGGGGGVVAVAATRR